MSPLLLPFQLVLLTFAGCVNRHQLDVIDYLQEENRAAKERLGGSHLRFTDAECRRLARKAQALGRKGTLSLSDGVRTQIGDVFEITAAPFMLPLRNALGSSMTPEFVVRSL